MSKKILIIDDDDFFALQLERIFGDTFELMHEWDGYTGIEKAISYKPEVILLDVEMPGMDGYEVCVELKKNPETCDIPVIFISSHADTEDRLKGYEAGGEDYIGKPPVPRELSRKIAVVLRNREKNAELASKAMNADFVANMAWEAVSETSMLMDFSRTIACCTGYVEIAEAALATLASYQLDVSVQLRSPSGSISRNYTGFCSQLEESVLHSVSSCGRIVDLGKRSAFNYERVTIVVNNMPRGDEVKEGKLRDMVALLGEAIDTRMTGLEVTFSAINRGDTLLNLLHRNATTLREIEVRYQNQREASADILNQLVKDVEDSFFFLGLTENQERFLQNLARDAVEKNQALYHDAVETDAIMRSLGDGLDATLQQELTGAADASETEVRIELF